MFEEAVSNPVSSSPFVTTSNFLLTSHLFFFFLFVCCASVGRLGGTCLLLLLSSNYPERPNSILYQRAFYLRAILISQNGCYMYLCSAISCVNLGSAPSPSSEFYVSSRKLFTFTLVRAMLCCVCMCFNLIVEFLRYHAARWTHVVHHWGGLHTDLLRLYFIFLLSFVCVFLWLLNDFIFSPPDRRSDASDLASWSTRNNA